MKEDKFNQIIEKRVFWTDYSINIVLDTLCPGLYDSSCFVRLSDNFSYKAKKSKEKFGKGINNCVFQETVKGVFLPNQMIICDSLYGFTSANIYDNNSTNESWLFVIFVKRNIYDSFFKIPYSGYEPADCLPHQVIDCLIKNFQGYIFNEKLGETNIAVENDPLNILRNAGSLVLNSVAICMLNNIPFFSLSEAINKISYLSYEKKMIGNNGILFAKRTRPNEIKLLSEKIENLIKFSKKIDVEPDPKTVDEINKAIDDCESIQAEIDAPYELPGAGKNVGYILSYKNPVPIGESRHIRKLLETTGNDIFLISDSDAVFGFGKVKSSTCGNFYIKFRDVGKWSFYLDDNCVLEYENGIPHLPKPEFSTESFRNSFFECFGKTELTENYAEKYSDIIESAVKEQNGAIIVINSNAKDEAQRLSKQSTCINTKKLDKNNIKALIKIDGAVLADQELNCYSFSVILDGIASCEVGTPARGSRYNSSYRYWYTRKEEGDKLLLVVISDDGMVDVIK